MILHSGDNGLSDIDILRTLHLAKVSDGRAANAFCSTLQFPWKTPTLPLALKGTRSRPARGLCVTTTSAAAPAKAFTLCSAVGSQEMLTSKPFSPSPELLFFLSGCKILLFLPGTIF